jgi:uncharacterized membrane protein
LFIGAAAYVLYTADEGGWGDNVLGLAGTLLVTAIAGIAGSMADSFVGAYWQRVHVCAVCGKETERAAHCGKAAAPLRGRAWMNNDVVNVIGSLAGGAAAWLLWALL